MTEQRDSFFAQASRAVNGGHSDQIFPGLFDASIVLP